MLHKAWNSKGKMPYCFPRSSIKFQGHTVQNITDFDPNLAFPDYRPVAALKSLRFALFSTSYLSPFFLHGWRHLGGRQAGGLLSRETIRLLWDCVHWVVSVQDKVRGSIMLLGPFPADRALDSFAAFPDVANSATLQTFRTALVNRDDNTVSIAVFCQDLSVVRHSHFADALVQNAQDTTYAHEKAGRLGGNADFINNGVHILRVLRHPLN